MRLTAQAPTPLRQVDAVCKVCGAKLETAASIGSKNGYALLRCASCASVTVHPFPSLAELQAFYQSYRGPTDYRAKKTSKIARATKRIRRLMKLTPGRKFLDIGCNYGFAVKAALELGLDAHGIDIDATAVAESNRSYGAGKFEAITVEDFAARGEKTDVVYSAEVIEHVHDPNAFMRAIAKILNQGGVAYLTTPEAGHWSVPRELSAWKEVRPPEHITFFTRQGMTALLEKHGLQVVTFSFSFKPGIRVIARKT